MRRAVVFLMLKRRSRPLFLGVTLLIVLAVVVALSPAPLEQSLPAVAPSLDPGTLVDPSAQSLATGIPTDRIPEYTVEKFDYVSTRNGEKQWNLKADKAYLYNQDKLVHARVIRAQLFDSDGKITHVTGREAKYFMQRESVRDKANPRPSASPGASERDLEIFGDVRTVFPDGFELQSAYMRYQPESRRIEIPTSFAVHGQSSPEDAERGERPVEFDSQGLLFPMSTPWITLPEAARLTSGSPKDFTRIEADRCVIHRFNQVARFSMRAGGDLDRRFVRIIQPKSYAQARDAVLHYGDRSKLLTYLTLEKDVLIVDRAESVGPRAPMPAGDPRKGSTRYATSGRADFDAKRDVIVLTQFPQVYQEGDTITGELITMHRDTDVVEVDQSNAFSSGDSLDKSKRQEEPQP